ncbi:transposase family Tnp2 protein [Rhizoctonia solani AG-3 Rhs1AP]|uniref:Transposase family Tnp2 protein n=1 Tax=Rhizoctonia solani AG-3 Rhs1AP TaxID=1086054 RepID=X8J4T8_9AGAM|nr:transposase family Tnp2 protein [Rhizoctonia solani AG-3 Rhs1AP]
MRSYDMCVNSCCCFLGKYAKAEECPFCHEVRYNHAGKARRTFQYTPLIPQLCALLQNREMVTNLRYRRLAERLYCPGVIQDVFDAEHYRRLRQTVLDETTGYHFFDDDDDLALGLSTDGVSLFKRRRRGQSTAWPIIIINYNLHPSIRTRLENVICVGVIPGPRQCKDLNSFLIPLLDELLELKGALDTPPATPPPAPPSHEIHASHVVLRAFLIILFGDIPAISKLLMMKGHNAILPCRLCYIQGVLCRLAKSSVYYVPLTRPGDPPIIVPPEQLVMRTHELFLAHYDALEALQTQTARKRLGQAFGINSRPVFSRLKSIDLAICAPYDAMHLLFENLVPNMIRHWTGGFKGLDQGTGDYEIPGNEWAEVGRLTARAGKTIPSAFVGTLPNIAEDEILYKAEGYSFFFQYIAPVVLEGRLPDKYYEHFLLMREIFILALQFELTFDDLDQLQQMINTWIAQYEEYYYQYDPARLPTCPLTIHALLHLPHYIRTSGPLWTSWAFVMERFCGHILPAVKNRIRPYGHLDNYVQRRAQMQAVSLKYELPSLAKPRINYTYAHGAKFSSRERMYPDFNTVILGAPVYRNVEVTPQLMNQLGKYFGLVYSEELRLNGQAIRARIVTDSMLGYGRFRLTGDGDRFRIAALIEDNRDARDNSFVRYELLPDANASLPDASDVMVRRVHYGQLLNIYYVEFITDVE